MLRLAEILVSTRSEVESALDQGGAGDAAGALSTLQKAIDGTRYAFTRAMSKSPAAVPKLQAVVDHLSMLGGVMDPFTIHRAMTQ